MNILGLFRSVHTVGDRVASEETLQRESDKKAEGLSLRDARQVQVPKRILHQFTKPVPPDDRQLEPQSGLETADAGARRYSRVIAPPKIMRDPTKNPSNDIQGDSDDDAEI